MQIATLIVVSLALLVSLADLVIDLRSSKPRKRAQILRDIARGAVLAAEVRGGEGQDKARFARQAVLDQATAQRIPCTGARAEALIHAALGEQK